MQSDEEILLSIAISIMMFTKSTYLINWDDFKIVKDGNSDMMHKQTHEDERKVSVEDVDSVVVNLRG